MCGPAVDGLMWFRDSRVSLGVTHAGIPRPCTLFCHNSTGGLEVVIQPADLACSIHIRTWIPIRNCGVSGRRSAGEVPGCLNEPPRSAPEGVWARAESAGAPPGLISGRNSRVRRVCRVTLDVRRGPRANVPREMQGRFQDRLKLEFSQGWICPGPGSEARPHHPT